MKIFKTERLLVRQYGAGDADDFFLLNGDEEVVRYIRPAKSRMEADAFLDEVMMAYEENPLYGRWAVEEKNSHQYIGSFALIPVEGKDQMQLGYALLPHYWGKGYATELTNGGLKYVFANTNIDPIYAYAELQNIASQKVLLKAGFTYMGTEKEGEKELTRFMFAREQYTKAKSDLLNSATKD